MTRTQIEILLGIILVTITGIVLIIIGLNEEDRMAEFEEYQIAQEIEVGAELYENNCRGCHGIRGEGVPSLAPPLNDAHFFTNRLDEVGWEGALHDYIIATVSTGRQVSTRPDLYPGAGSPAMPTWSERFGGPLRDNQIEAISSFIMNWESTALGEVEIGELPTPTPLPGEEEVDDPVARGLTVYNNNGCGGCHTIEGISTGAVGPILSQIGEVAADRQDGMSPEDYLRESILNPSAHIVEGYDDMMPKNFGDSLSDDELSDLVAFLMAQK
ncbi:MAG: cytochrome c [Anaerolineales bacterium]|jgi:mono/diheme cytochrome c family protein